ncbi:hypothetical protein N2152v2_004602 [Parachlorella kessleri]
MLETAPSLGLSGAFWFDGVDVDDVPLVTVEGGPGLDLFDITLPVVSLPPDVPEQPPQHAQPQKPKKKSLTKAEKARIEREKNREIQARYRQRQKEKREHLVAEHEAAAADLERLRLEQETLQERNSVLEHVLEWRDEEVQVLEAAQHDDPCQPEGGTYYDPRDGSFWAPGPGGNNNASGTSTTTVFAAAAGTVAADLPTAMGPPGRGSSPRIRELRDGSEGASSSSTGPAASGGGAEDGEGASSSSAAASASGSASAASDAHLASVVMPGTEGADGRIQVPKAVIDKAKNMTADDYFKNWQEFAARLRDILARYDVTKDPRSLDELEPLLKRRAVVMTLMLHHNPGCIKSLFLRSGEQGSPAEQEHFWNALVVAMQITPAQRERYLTLWDSYQHKVERFRSNRNKALTLIRSASQDSLCSDNMAAMMSHYLQLLEGAASLSAYPDNEFVALLELLSESGRILTPVQKARMASWSFPFFPDVLQIMQAITRLPPPAGSAPDVGDSGTLQVPPSTCP